ncbi:MAG: hypothetical protein QM767_09345 [Anaeromyxobacter sp.]
MRFEVGKLFELGKRRRLPMRDMDLGYLLHCELGELFGARAPRPFSIRGSTARHVDVLAYTECPKAALEEHARAFADPAVFAACDFEGLQEKPHAVAVGIRPAVRVRGPRLPDRPDEQ